MSRLSIGNPVISLIDSGEDVLARRPVDLDPTGPRAGKGQLAAKSSLRVWGCCSVTRPPDTKLKTKQKKRNKTNETITAMVTQRSHVNPSGLVLYRCHSQSPLSVLTLGH